MNSSVKNMLKKVSALILFIIIVSSMSYLVVYKASFLPSGYDIVSQQKDRVTVQSFNVIGMEKDTTTVVFSEDDVWKIEYLSDQIARQKGFLWLLFTTSSISTLILVIKLREGKKWWSAIWDSSLIFTIIIPLFSINGALTTVQVLIGKL